LVIADVNQHRSWLSMAWEFTGRAIRNRFMNMIKSIESATMLIAQISREAETQLRTASSLVA